MSWDPSNASAAFHKQNTFQMAYVQSNGSKDQKISRHGSKKACTS